MVQDGFEQPSAVGPGGRELRFQSVAQRHQFVHFGDDAVLFGKGREGKYYLRQCYTSEMRNADSRVLRLKNPGVKIDEYALGEEIALQEGAGSHPM